MQQIFILAKKEFKSFFLSPIAYIFITVYLIITNYLYFQGFFLINQADMHQYFSILPWVFLFLVPAITMRSWAEERKVKTIELLLTWPVSDFQVVMGKFLASLAFLIIAIVLSVTIPITLSILGNPDGGAIFTSYLGAILMGAAYLAIGLWMSSLTENQILGFLGGVVAILALLLIGNSYVTLNIPTFLVPLFTSLGLGTHFESISRGVIDSRDILYYLSVICFFLFLNIRTIESRKW